MKQLFYTMFIAALLCSNIVNAQNKELEQVPIHIYDQLKKFEINKHLSFVASIPLKTYQSKNGYILEYSDRIVNTDKDGNNFQFERTNQNGQKEIYNLRFIKGVIFGTRERYNDEKFEYTTFKGKKEDWTTEI